MSAELGGRRRQQRCLSPGLGLGVGGGILTGLGPLRLLQRSGDLLFFFSCFARANLSVMGPGAGQRGVCWAALWAVGWDASPGCLQGREGDSVSLEERLPPKL